MFSLAEKFKRYKQIKEANKEPNSNIIQQMKLVDKFYKSLPTTHGKHIVNMEFLYSAINNLETKLKEKIKCKLN